MIVAGGEGMGTISKMVKALDAQPLDVQIVVICGRNDDLRRRLLARNWKNVHHIFWIRQQQSRNAEADGCFGYYRYQSGTFYHK